MFMFLLHSRKKTAKRQVSKTLLYLPIGYPENISRIKYEITLNYISVYCLNLEVCAVAGIIGKE